MTSLTERHLHIRPVRIQDLELLIAWRSNPEVFEHFREQDAPVEWEEHLSWFASRPKERFDYVIEYRGRRVGSVSVDPDRYVGVYVGETSLWGEGIGSSAVEWVCQEFAPEPLYAEIHTENEASQRLFEACGFVREDQNGEWTIYKHAN